MKGLFIVMEGPDGSGKTTQINLLEQYLKEAGYECLITRDPGGTVIGEEVRELILNPEDVSGYRDASLCGIQGTACT